MVQSYKSPVRVYKYPFEIVMAAYEKRFPKCPQIPIVVETEITEEETSADGSKTVVERKCHLNPPYLFKKVAGVDRIYFSQKNTLDRRNRTLHIAATNICFAQRVVIKEHCVYYVNPENPNWTSYEQDAYLEVKSFFGCESFVEKIAVDQFTNKLAKSKEIMQHFIDELLKSGITHIPPFEIGAADDEEQLQEKTTRLAQQPAFNLL